MESKHWYSNLLDADSFEVPTAAQYLWLQNSEEKWVWIIRSEKSILGYFGPFKTSEEATKSTVLKRDPLSRLEMVRLKDLR